MSSDDVPSNDDHLYDSVPDVNSVAKEDEQEDCGNQEQQDQEERASISSTSVFDHKRNSDVYLPPTRLVPGYQNSFGKNFYPDRSSWSEDGSSVGLVTKKLSSIPLRIILVILLIVVVVLAVCLGVFLTKESSEEKVKIIEKPLVEEVEKRVIVTYTGSLRMPNKAFTNELYNTKSVQFKTMENYVCDMLDVGASKQKCVVTRFSNGSVISFFLLQEVINFIINPELQSRLRAQELANERAQMRLEILERNPNIDDPSLTVTLITEDDPSTPGNNNNNNNVDCSISQFSCELGGCVDASQKCDRVSQCSNINFGDISDEENCVCILHRPCQNGGTCALNINSESGYICTCEEGYAGVNCQDEIPCEQDNPCRNGGTCRGTNFNYQCSCTENYTGTNCESEFTCNKDNPCQNGGSCYGTMSDYQCSCSEGYTGSNCENVIPCSSSNPCENGGTCYGTLLNYQCVCPNEYTGTNCENEIPCNSNNPCQNGGSCYGTKLSYQCSCSEGYTGTNCEREIPCNRNSPCLHGGTCYGTMLSYQCHCVQGYTGTNCENEIPCNRNNPCDNGGTCQGTLLSYQCFCSKGYSGINCENEIPCNRNNPCQNGGSCYGTILSYQCSCAEGYTGTNCENEIPCNRNNPCQNGATCYGTMLSYQCGCTKGYMGTNCENEIPCNRNNPCQNGGTCYGTMLDYQCVCPNGYTGTNCENEIPCNRNNPCQNGGSCSGTKLSYQCSCAEGYTGTNCENEIMCNTDNPCRNGGTCSGTLLRYQCSCTDGYTGINCESVVDVPCGGVLTGDTGEITSPNYPNKYPNKKLCTWTINGKPQKKIKVRFLDFDVQYQYSCAYDWVRAFSGSEADYQRKISQQCGSSIPSDIIGEDGEALTIQFSSDNYGRRRGFRAQYSLIDYQLEQTTSLPVRQTTESYRRVLTVTYGGSLRMEDKVFTDELYNPNSVQFKDMEKYVCDMLAFEDSTQECMVTRFSQGSVVADFGIQEILDLDTDPAASDQSAQELADERAGMRTDILETNPNVGDVSLTVTLIIDGETTTPSNSNNNNNNTNNNIDIYCTISQFTCELGGCVDPSQECDGVAQCSSINFGDMSDEANCVCILHEPCQNGGTCTLNEDNESGYTCTCADGYTGVNCRHEIPCDTNNRCRNGGTCSGTVLSYQCSCAEGYTGTNCENEIPCSSDNPCSNGGTCIGTVLTYQCVCPNGYTGSNCENEIPCNRNNPCRSGGTCSGTVLSYQCSCRVGYTGTNCESEIPCSDDKPCENGGTCHGTVLSYRCACAEGYRGTHCQNEILCSQDNPCQNGGTCSGTILRYQCSCREGYTGTNCENEIPCDQDNPCHNGGTCFGTILSYQCSCPNGYTGNNCENEIPCNRNDPCRNGGTCSGTVLSYQCSCRVGYTGTNCENEIPCNSNNPCRNGGTCYGTLLSYQCVCPNGYQGNNCQNEIPCNRNNPCQNGGTCSGTVLSYQCSCRVGYTGTNCENEIPCNSNNPCRNGGTCYGSLLSYQCVCHNGYTGTNCENEIPCNRNNPCHNGGICIGTLLSYQCVCPNGYTGTNCENEILCSQDNPCQNGGTCSGTILRYQCSCREGYTGTNCENIVDIPCGGVLTGDTGEISSPNYPNYYPNNKLCTWTITGQPQKKIKVTFLDFDLQFGNTCPYDWVRAFRGSEPYGLSLIQACGNTIPNDIIGDVGDDLTVQFCSDGAITRRGFRAQYSFIEEIPCSQDNPCQNGGTCSGTVSNYQCSCVEGYTGANCENIVDVPCGGVLSGDTGEFSSPNYPNYYPNNKLCTWTITGQPQKKIKVTFLDFDLQFGNNCPYDWVRAFRGSEPYGLSIIQACGNTIPNDIIGDVGDDLTVQFCSDNAITRRGFRAQYSFIDVEPEQTTTLPVDPACGGNLTGLSGEFSSPNYPNDYPSDKLCTWKITGQPGKVIKVTFLDFDLQQGYFDSYCPYDWVRAFRGSVAIYGLRIFQRCGDTIPDDIIGQVGESLTVQFCSNYAVQKPGFRAQYTFIDNPATTPDPVDQSCGGVLTGDGGDLCSPNYPGNYPNNKLCTWTITGQPGKRIRVTFLDFDIQYGEICQFDWVRAFSGSDQYGTKIFQACGYTIPADIIENGEALTIQFCSDYATRRKGFHARYTIIDLPTTLPTVLPTIDPGDQTCGGVLTGNTGDLCSPNYPGFYPNNKLCTWTITGQPGKRIRVTFLDFDIQYGEICQYDWVRAFSGSDQYGTKIFQACGYSIPQDIIENGEALTIQFCSDNFDWRRGFHARYTIIDVPTTLPTVLPTIDPGDQTCGRVLTGITGDLCSPNYPGFYPNNKLCTWTITGQPGKTIRVTFLDFNIQYGDFCQFDWVRAFSGSTQYGNQIFQACGYGIPADIVQEGDALTIQFCSDNFGQRVGFHARYTIIDSQTTLPPVLSTIDPVDQTCGGVLTGNTGDLCSPNYPGNYPSNKLCTWTITGQPEKTIRVTFLDFDIQYGNSCQFDWVRAFSGSDQYGNQIFLACGFTIPADIVEEGDALTIQFCSDYVNSRRGFHARYTIVDDLIPETNPETTLPTVGPVDESCGGALTGDTGEISSPNYPNRYPNNELCTWTIAGQSGKAIKVTFLDFVVEYDLTCNFDWVRAFRGNDQYGTKIFERCGNTIPDDIIGEVGEALTVQFCSDSSVKRRGFRAQYSLIDYVSPCENVNCANGGTCVPNGLYAYQCQCAPGWIGEFCEVEPCVQHVDSDEFIIELPTSYHECSYVITPSNPESSTEVTIDDHFSSLTWRDYQRLCTYVQVIYPTDYGAPVTCNPFCGFGLLSFSKTGNFTIPVSVFSPFPSFTLTITKTEIPASG